MEIKTVPRIEIIKAGHLGNVIELSGLIWKHMITTLNNSQKSLNLAESGKIHSCI